VAAAREFGEETQKRKVSTHQITQRDPQITLKEIIVCMPPTVPCWPLQLFTKMAAQQSSQAEPKIGGVSLQYENSGFQNHPKFPAGLAHGPAGLGQLWQWRHARNNSSRCQHTVLTSGQKNKIFHCCALSTDVYSVKCTEVYMYAVAAHKRVHQQQPRCASVSAVQRKVGMTESANSCCRLRLRVA
jgi:hypothetical protein